MHSTSTTTANIKKVISLNTTALDCMSQGLYRQAQLTLRQALEELKSYANGMIPEAASHTHNEEICIHVFPSKVLDHYKDASCQLFTRPFYIVSNQEVSELSCVSETDVNLLSAALLFNMALSYQVKSGFSADNKKATAFYRLALSTCQRIQVHCQQDAETCLLAVALGNNLACCFADYFLYQQLESCIEWTLEAAEEMMGDYSFFWTNLIAWQNTECLAASAA